MSTKISFTKRSAVGLLCALVAIAISTQASESSSAYAPVNGLKMYYEIHGDTGSKGPPLVLLHGGGSTEIRPPQRPLAPTAPEVSIA
jgi:hypothetical protein